MLSSPYPVPDLRIWRAAMVLGWAAGTAAGVWVLVSPPKSYDGLGLILTTMWGIMLAVGSLLVTIGHITRRYQVEIPGLVIALGGITLYAYLSWWQTLTDSPGSGPRALLLLLLAGFIVGRIRLLLRIDQIARRMIEIREDAG